MIVMEGSRGFDLNVLDFSGILNKIADLIKDSYVFITDTESDITYITDKAAKYFGLTKKQIEEFRPYYNSYEKITSYIKEIQNRQILEYMISNCSNIFILMDGGTKHMQLGEQAYQLYEQLGFPYEEVRRIVNKYQYRTDV